jgi:aminocarboxymuconate-semialdehyde decarboxylase
MVSRRSFLVGSLAGGAVAAAAPLLAQITKASAPTDKPWTIPQQPTPPVAIDMHTHWAPDSYLKAKAALGQPDFLDPINNDQPRRAKWMEAHGIQTGVLTLGGFRPWVWVTPEQGARIAAVSNDAAIAAHIAYPKTFVAGIELNCSDPAGALRELNRVAGKPGMVAVHLPTSLAGKDFLYDDAFAPIFARAQDLGLPIILHPLDGEANWFGGKRLADVASGADPNAPEMAARFPGLTNSLGNTLEMGVCMAKLMTSGVLDRYPELIFVASCGGGTFPQAAGRMDARGGGRLKQPIATYLRRFYYDSLVFWPESLRYLVSLVGADRVVLGTDNMYGPGDSQLSNQPLSVIQQARLSREDSDLIYSGNARRLLKI